MQCVLAIWQILDGNNCIHVLLHHSMLFWLANFSSYYALGLEVPWALELPWYLVILTIKWPLNLRWIAWKESKPLQHTRQSIKSYCWSMYSTNIALMVICAVFQNPHKFFPEERFGDESPVLALRQSGRCRVNSTPAVESMFTDLEALVGFRPPLPPPPPPYHPPATPGHSQQQYKTGWRPRVPTQPPSRSFSYPCNHALLHRQPSSKMGSPVYPPGAKPLPPDCTNAQGGRNLHPDKQMVINTNILF